MLTSDARIPTSDVGDGSAAGGGSLSSRSAPLPLNRGHSCSRQLNLEPSCRRSRRGYCWRGGRGLGGWTGSALIAGKLRPSWCRGHSCRSLFKHVLYVPPGSCFRFDDTGMAVHHPDSTWPAVRVIRIVEAVEVAPQTQSSTESSPQLLKRGEVQRLFHKRIYPMKQGFSSFLPCHG